MEGLDFFAKILKKYPSETILIATATCITLISLFLYIKAGNASPANKNVIKIQQPVLTPSISPATKHMFVDISGAVISPNIYKIKENTRLQDVLIMAGGLSADANRDFFYRNFNLSSYVYDQEKIYIPHNYEIWRGIFTEPKRIVDFTKPVYKNQVKGTPQDILSSSKININTANFSELDTLPGIGPATAQKIIKNRPYNSTQELLTKKIVSRNTFEKIKEKINTN